MSGKKKNDKIEEISAGEDFLEASMDETALDGTLRWTEGAEKEVDQNDRWNMMERRRSLVSELQSIKKTE